MIGQTELLAQIDELLENDKFPRFSIIEGAYGSGKNLVVRRIRNSMHTSVIELQPTVDDVRTAIAQSYKIIGTPVIYYFRNADNMSLSAKNALLKITEEPPNNAYFILTVTNIANILPTIRSRAIVFKMQPYLFTELTEYMIKAEVLTTVEEKQIALQICETPGEINLLSVNEPIKLYEFVKKVIDNVDGVSIANALKISEKIAFTEEDKGYDLVLFWKCVVKVYSDYINSKVVSIDENELNRIAKAVMVTRESINLCVNTRGLNKRTLFDIWIIELRKALRGD